jgi:predicted RNase H-like HicB family nuclease
MYHLANGLRKIGVDFHESNDVRVQTMQKTIKKLGSIEFKIELHADGSWVAESVNIDGILTGGTKRKDMNEMIRDAIFTYFEIPPHLCNEKLMHTSEESVMLEQRVYA